MTFTIITHVIHHQEDNHYCGYAPYINEMNLWLKHVKKVIIVAPLASVPQKNLSASYDHPNIIFKQIPAIQFTSLKSGIRSCFLIPLIFWKIFIAFVQSQHLHLRCPGNIGLLGCIAQVFFPFKQKTAKYAGNWDPDAKQPFSYKLQKWILSNTFLSKNVKVLVYGKWLNQSSNVVPFFTASYYENEKEEIQQRDYQNTLNFLFIGTLSEGKRPLLVLKIIQKLYEKGINCFLDIYGEGKLKKEVEEYVNSNNLKAFIRYHGSKDKKIIKASLKHAHFLMLPSKSEGWPKVVAEAMFWGTIPIATAVSCIPWMLDYGERGIIIEPQVEIAVNKIISELESVERLKALNKKAVLWSRNYTLDKFENAIEKMISQCE